MLDISLFNERFDPKLKFDERLENYTKNKIEIFTNRNLIIISGEIAVGKSTLIRMLKKQCDNYRIIESISDFKKCLENLSNNDILCIESIGDEELESVLSDLMKIQNKVVFTTIALGYLEQYKTWPKFMEIQRIRAKMRTSPVHLRLTREDILAENIF
ncbi:hypothetical protein BKK52_01315 [Rodentibacter trehalosifermentans]|uniref:Novel STAND NTPase 3 domain-containing protein n=2 Tax=Rodentibacter TaxID=1960084 RepID=A0A4S2Q387_9PAST|nr:MULTISPECIES: deoxynucleoside kinase [Rodentibacter]OOF50815.1 hypothetical protein BKK52_01315 [Rodentibacter trehalosifermentans]THA10991.1 hypothetical protein D3M78_00950 [Rodentibacter pneumotropicus]